MKLSEQGLTIRSHDIKCLWLLLSHTIRLQSLQGKQEWKRDGGKRSSIVLHGFRGHFVSLLHVLSGAFS